MLFSGWEPFPISPVLSSDLQPTGDREGLHLGSVLDRMAEAMGETYPPSDPTARFVAGFTWETAVEYMHSGMTLDDAMDAAFRRYMIAVRKDVQTQVHLERDGIRATPDAFNPGVGEVESFKNSWRKMPSSQEEFEDKFWRWVTQEKSYCVPTRARILTRKGWARYDETLLGQSVLGFNARWGRCEWTTLRAVNLPGPMKTFQYGNRRFKVWCTEDHNWVFTHRNSDPYEHTRRRTIRGLRHDSGGNLGGWSLLRTAPCPPGEGLPRFRYDELLSRGNTVEAVMLMTREERQSFILGMLAGEGHHSKSTIGFSQNAGPVMDGFRLACFLNEVPTSMPKRDPKSDCYRINLIQRPYVCLEGLETLSTAVEDVWCPTTDLRTWVMELDGEISITGNCYLLGVDTARWVVLWNRGNYRDIQGPVVMQATAKWTGEELVGNWKLILKHAEALREEKV